jgi:hypothetical protein
MGELPGLPSIEELAERTLDRDPGELEARVLHAMSEADSPPRQREPEVPDVSDLLRKLGADHGSPFPRPGDGSR